MNKPQLFGVFTLLSLLFLLLALGHTASIANISKPILTAKPCCWFTKMMRSWPLWLTLSSKVIMASSV